jgi:fatty-acyl-CoA synthase
VLLDALPVTAVGKIFKPTLRDLAVQEKVRFEIDRIFGAETAAEILVEKDDRLNTVVSILLKSSDETRIKVLAESLVTLPQTYRIETRST